MQYPWALPAAHLISSPYEFYKAYAIVN